MRIRYSPAAKEDLRNLKDYLTLEFGATVAAKSLARIVADISALKNHCHLARPLSDKVGRDTSYLYFLAGKRSVAILSEDMDVLSVVRVLDSRTDYVRAILGE